MLCVRIEGRDVATTPASLARMVLDGRLDRGSPSRIAEGESEQSLEQSLGSSHCEALTAELLRRLRAMYSLGSSDVDIQELRARVEALCQWRWAHPPLAARFFWAAAWLNELMDRVESAAGFYDAFLQMSCGDNLLRLLAYNNRGVLRVRLGRLEGVQDLARAAIPDGGEGARVRPRTLEAGLPAACFNLLNLINVSMYVDRIKQAIDSELASFFLHLPQETRTQWLGSTEAGSTEGYALEDRLVLRGPTPESLYPTVREDALLILRDPTFRRLNTLTTHLAAQTRRWIATEGSPPVEPGRDADRTSGPLARSAFGTQPLLALWECRADGHGARACDGGLTGSLAAHPLPALPERPTTEPQSAGYGEAASLLLSDEIPSSLVRRDNPLSRAEQLAREELADIEGHLAQGHHELARSRLQAQHRILSALNRGGGCAGLLARVEAQLEKITRIEAQNEHVEFQRACSRLIAEVERFCRGTDLCRAERELHDLDPRLQALRAQAVPESGAEAVGLLEELHARVERHMGRLRRLEIRRRIRRSLRQVRQDWPVGWTSPVRESAYQALAQCHLNDPEGTVRDWAGLREQLDTHQGHYHLHNALAALQADHVVWDRVEEELARALCLQPALWLTAAPLFGLSAPSGAVAARGATDAHLSLRADAQCLSEKVLRSSGRPGENGEYVPMQRAGRLLKRTFREIAAGPKAVLQLWQQVEATLSPVLAGGDAEAIAEVRVLAERCLDCWPAGPAGLPGPADPRHPVRLFLESCERARRLAEAEGLLHARPGRLDEAKRSYAELLAAGLDTRDQLRRVVTGLYLSGFSGPDAPPAQRRMLTHLETWVETMPVEVQAGLREPEVVREVEQAREALAAGPPAPAMRSPSPQVVAEGRIVPASAVDGCQDIRDGSETNHNAWEEQNNRPVS